MVIVERYPDPTTPRGFNFMAHDDVDPSGFGIYGFGPTEADARRDFERQQAEETS